jgi:hypothetical protein
MAKGRRISSTRTVPAPVGGWNARDSVVGMKETDAVILENIFPLTNDVMLRKGYSNHATGITGNVETLMAWNYGSSSKLYAIASGSVYDVTASGAVGAASKTGLTNSKWQHCNITTAGGNFLFMVNGTDHAYTWDGSNWVDREAGITGVSSATIEHVCLHMNRLFLTQKNSLKVWYLPTSSISGAASALDFSALADRGGYLMACGSWTLDSGSGMDDHFVAITSEGEVFIYQGIDPSSSTTWSLVGKYVIGNPVGRRCLVKYASDLLVICQDGLMPLSKALMSSRVNTKSSLTDKIQLAMSEAVTNYGSNFGWETIIYPTENMLILNIPTSATTSQQFAMQTITGAWCKFTGWNAYCWETLGNSLYFGTSGAVCHAWDTTADDGNNINAEALQAFNQFGSNNQKWFKEARPIIYTDSQSLGILLGINVDYDQTAPTGSPTFTVTSSGAWDSSTWDGAVWGGDLSIIKSWQTVGAVGYSAGMHIMLAARNSNMRWQATTYLYESGIGL